MFVQSVKSNLEKPCSGVSPAVRAGGAPRIIVFGRRRWENECYRVKCIEIFRNALLQWALVSSVGFADMIRHAFYFRSPMGPHSSSCPNVFSIENVLLTVFFRADNKRRKNLACQYSIQWDTIDITRHSSQTLQTFPPRQVKISGGSTDCETKP